MQLCLDYELRFIDWIPPEKEDTLYTYAGKLSKLIDQSRPFSLMGVSMGGMMCMELAKHVKAEKVILISSAKTPAELPSHLKLLRKLKLSRLTPAATFKKVILAYNALTSDLKGTSKDIFTHMVNDCDPTFLMWVANAILEWDNKEVPDNVVHIHGDNDNVIFYKFVKPDITIPGGTHYMVGTRADEVNAILGEVLP